MGPGDLSELLQTLNLNSGGDDRVLVGPETADDAGVFAFAGDGLVATADFITPVCDDPYRYGRVAAANSLSDVFAMGGEVLFALNLCCFPEGKAPTDVFAAILRGALDTLHEAGGALLGGHSVSDDELKFGMAVIGRVDPGRILTNAGARPGQALVLTKPLGSGALLNGYRAGKLDDEALDPLLTSMERLNDTAARLALEHEATGCTDITGFGLAGHALEVARASGVGIRLQADSLPVYDGFYEMVAAGVSTAGTRKNRQATAELVSVADVKPEYEELLFDPQTSGGLLICTPRERAASLLEGLQATGHVAAIVGEVVDGRPQISIV